MGLDMCHYLLIHSSMPQFSVKIILDGFVSILLVWLYVTDNLLQIH